jgi:hypothetical protein
MAGVTALNDIFSLSHLAVRFAVFPSRLEGDNCIQK